MLGVFSCVFLAPSSKYYCFYFAPCLNAIKTWFALIYFFFFPISIFSHEIEEEREKEKKVMLNIEIKSLPELLKESLRRRSKNSKCC
jgi:hypothetical protein